MHITESIGLFSRLKTAAIEVYEDFSEELLEKLIITMPHRIKAIINANR